MIDTSIIEFRHILHQNAELSLKEHKTKKLILEALSKLNKLKVYDEGAWILCVYNSDNALKDPIAFRADFDALPITETIDKPWVSLNKDVSHRCGHDGHTAVLFGLAQYLQEHGADRDVYLIFQHAEEIGAGACVCAEFMKQFNIKGVYAFHNWSGFPEGTVEVRNGTSQLASKGITYSFTGKESHASQPEDENNPAEAVSKLAVSVNEVLRNTDFSGLTLATIVNISVGSKNFGINPGYGEVSMTIRAETERDMNLLENKIRDSAEALSKEYSLSLSYSETDVFPETANDAESVQNVISACERAGVPYEILEKPFRSSEDFGWFTKAFGGAIFYIGNGEEYPQIHTTEYDFNDRILPVALKVFESILNE